MGRLQHGFSPQIFVQRDDAPLVVRLHHRHLGVLLAHDDAKLRLCALGDNGKPCLDLLPLSCSGIAGAYLFEALAVLRLHFFHCGLIAALNLDACCIGLVDKCASPCVRFGFQLLASLQALGNGR